MFPNVKYLELSTGKKVKYFDLTLELMDKIDRDSSNDTLSAVISCGTELSEDEIGTLRRYDANSLYDAILRVTYPELFNEDGTLKDEKAENSKIKKKV